MTVVKIEVCNGFTTGFTNIYIGRPGKGKKGSSLANPFKVEDSSRAECIELYRKWLWDKLQTETPQRKEIRYLAKRYIQGETLRLDCFCSPKICHGDVIKSCILWYVENQIQFYTGVGSRETPKDVLSQMTQIAADRDDSDFILRSGGAKGADSAFELGAVYSQFSFRTSSYFTKVSEFAYNKDLWLEAEKIAASVHPVWGKLKLYYKQLHTRNVFQVLGQDLNSPSKELICWTPDGADGSKKKTARTTGGTATSIKIATLNNVPVINLKNGN